MLFMPFIHGSIYDSSCIRVWADSMVFLLLSVSLFTSTANYSNNYSFFSLGSSYTFIIMCDTQQDTVLIGDKKCWHKMDDEVKITNMYLLRYFIIFLWPTVPSLFIRIAIYTKGTKWCTLCLSSTFSCQILLWLGVAKSIHDLSWYWWCMNVLHLQDLYINYVGSLSKFKRLRLNIRFLPPLVSTSADKCYSM